MTIVTDVGTRRLLSTACYASVLHRSAKFDWNLKEASLTALT